MLYVKESCPICLTGDVGFRLCSDHDNVVLMCDECDSVWLDPRELDSAHVIYPQPPDFVVAPHCSVASPRSRWATREEVAEAGWSGYVAGEGGSLDDVCQDSKG
jgi:Zn-finger nucleic acid-binding protein